MISQRSLTVTAANQILQRGLSLALPVLLLGGLLLLLNACGGTTEDPLARYRPAMLPDFQNELVDLTFPRYNIDVELYPRENRLRGKMQLTLVNDSPDLWRYLIFRLYPQLKDYKGIMTIHSAVVSGQKYPTPQVVVASYQNDNTALSVQLPDFLRPDEELTIDLSWTLDYPVWADTTNVYALFGQSQSMISLPLFYPSLAVYQPATGLKSSEWWLDEGTIRGDAAYNLASLFVVTATMPADQVPVTSGTLITSTFVEGERARHVWVTGPSREFLLHTSNQFRSTSTEADGTRITSYWLPGQEGMGWAALRYATAALRIYNDEFGPYPYRDMRVAPAPLFFRGMEYPQVNLLGVEVYGRQQNQLELLLAHEIAHQWWYQIVHNDPVNEPWLDEALAEYSMKLYLEQLRGGNSAAQLQLQRWDNPVKSMKTEGDATLIDQAVGDFASSSLYETVIYAKGALFYDSLRQTLGDRRFKRFLQDYIADHRYGIVTTEDWLQAVRELNTPSLELLYEDWVRRPAPNAAPTVVPPVNAASVP